VRIESVEQNGIPNVQVFNLAVEAFRLREVCRRRKVVTTVFMLEKGLKISIPVCLILPVRYSQSHKIGKSLLAVPVEQFRGIYLKGAEAVVV
jgi:hypothetical protein